MQPELIYLAKWYKDQTGFGLPEMQNDLRAVLFHRRKALYNGPLEDIKRSLAFTEIIKAAICLETGQDYETEFSKSTLANFRKFANPNPRMYVCHKCGVEYPAYSFAPNSKYCIRCATEIKKIADINRMYQKTGGYINRKGAIICTV